MDPEIAKLIPGLAMVAALVLIWTRRVRVAGWTGGLERLTQVVATVAVLVTGGILGDLVGKVPLQYWLSSADIRNVLLAVWLPVLALLIASRIAARIGV